MAIRRPKTMATSMIKSRVPLKMMKKPITVKGKNIQGLPKVAAMKNTCVAMKKVLTAGWSKSRRSSCVEIIVPTAADLNQEIAKRSFKEFYLATVKKGFPLRLEAAPKAARPLKKLGVSEKKHTLHELKLSLWYLTKPHLEHIISKSLGLAGVKYKQGEKQLLVNRIVVFLESGGKDVAFEPEMPQASIKQFSSKCCEQFDGDRLADENYILYDAETKKNTFIQTRFFRDWWKRKYGEDFKTELHTMRWLLGRLWGGRPPQIKDWFKRLEEDRKEHKSRTSSENDFDEPSCCLCRFHMKIQKMNGNSVPRNKASGMWNSCQKSEMAKCNLLLAKLL